MSMRKEGIQTRKRKPKAIKTTKSSVLPGNNRETAAETMNYKIKDSK